MSIPQILQAFLSVVGGAVLKELVERLFDLLKDRYSPRLNDDAD